MKTGDIILIRFPFTDLSSNKLRPCTVITTTPDHYGDIIVAAISSQVSPNLSKHELLLDASSTNGLAVRSVLKVDKLFTLQHSLYYKTLGHLDQYDLAQMITIFKSLVD
ncbi:MAG: type II toxin-antitoxin system PemK/MazF family toxin [Chitinophagales bacterium]|nr:type II toxin-antitoxin system PemK/MazF family toxin [Chitinophagales bacterium]